MELQLQQLDIPPRITVQKNLLAIFGVNSEGQITKDLREARGETAGVTTGKKKVTTTTTKSKGKEKVRGKKKKKGKKKAAHDEDGDEEDEEDEEIQDDDSAWVESGEDEDGDRDGNEERARVRHETKKKKNGDLIARHAEWTETHAVLVGSKANGREKNTPVLNFNKSPPNFHKSWKKVSTLSKDRTNAAMRGLALIDWTTWEWKDIPSQSFTRIMRSFAAAAIAESSSIISYRHEMIFCQPYGGATTIRIRAQDVVSHLLMPKDPGQTRAYRQTTLKDLVGSASQGSKAGEGLVLTEGSLPPHDTITWADGIYPPVPEKGYVAHVIEDELAHLEREKALGAQQRAVQKAIDAVQDMRVAWHDPTSTVHTRDNPPLDEDVASALQTLV